jgi:hypothetical protein
MPPFFGVPAVVFAVGAALTALAAPAVLAGESAAVGAIAPLACGELCTAVLFTAGVLVALELLDPHAERIAAAVVAAAPTSRLRRRNRVSRRDSLLLSIGYTPFLAAYAAHHCPT